MEGAPIPATVIEVLRVKTRLIERDRPVRELSPQPFRHQIRLVPEGTIAAIATDATLIGTVDQPEKGCVAVVHHHGEDGNEG
jgi:hypothetical protein